MVVHVMIVPRRVTVYCKDCGGIMEGDGFSVVIHCPNAEYIKYYDKEPDAAPVHCDFKDTDEGILPQV